MSTSSANYCVFQASHQHGLSQINNSSSSSGGVDFPFRFLFNNQDEEEAKLIEGEERGSASLAKAESVATGRHGNQDFQQKQQLLDPYIDAVQVKTRINNKRGVRVKPALMRADHEPTPSYYSKIVHVEESKYESEEWDSSDSGEDDDDHDDHHGGKKKQYKKKKHHKKKNNKNHGKKRIYVKKAYPKKKSHYKTGHYGGKKPMKVYLYEKHGGAHKHKHHHHHHKGANKYHDYHGEEKDSGHYGKQHKSVGKLVHLNLIDKGSVGGGGGKMSLAGLLGYTLLCVNYLLVLQQPTYDKLSGHYYTKYSPHGGKGDVVEIKTGSPVLLAHCADLKADEVMKDQVIGSMSSLSAASTAPKQNRSQLELPKQAAASANQYYLQGTFRGSPASLPPAYYYTLAPTSRSQQADNQLVQRQQQQQSSFLSPIQNYLNRLLLPTAGSDEDSPSGEQLVVGAPRTRLELIGGGQLSPTAGGQFRRARLMDLALDGVQPQVVGVSDNLVELRKRQIGVSLHVVSRSRFATNPQQRLMSLTRGGGGLLAALQENSDEEDDNNERMQADQPANQAGERSRQTQRQTGVGNNGALQSPGNNQILDLPDYALSGDSIQLTCNHRMPLSRLYSVKWFKDSLEFYRFIPANGARSKSSLFLPDVRLDLARSNSESLLLRNVSHRSSGLYRCEVVSEGPNFETLSGEKRMQVYSLPESGPQLALLEQTSSELPTITTTTARTTVTALATLPVEREDEQVAVRERERLTSGSSGPLVHCASARSSPAAQLRFFINNRPIELTRIIENSTLSYSDAMESSIVSFRLALSDFLLSEDNQLDRAASLKSKPANSGQQQQQQQQRGSTTTTITTTTTTSTTTSTTTPKPARDKPNAEVQFDDQADGGKLVSAGKKSQKEKRKRTKQKTTPKQLAKESLDVDADYDADGGTEEPQQRFYQAAKSEKLSLEQLPASLDKAKTDRKRVGAAKRGAPEKGINIDSMTNYQASVDDELEARAGGEFVAQSESTIPTAGATSASAQPSAGANQRLARQEQRVRQTSSSNGGNNNNNNNRGQLYSNYIRIKCTSLVPAVGYEMTSELSVPLTLLVPASQLSETASLEGGRLQEDDEDGDAAARRRQEQRQQDSLFGTSQRGPIRSSLQAPRAVLIDRLAQASTPSFRSAEMVKSVAGAGSSSAPPGRTSQQGARASGDLAARLRTNDSPKAGSSSGANTSKSFWCPSSYPQTLLVAALTFSMLQISLESSRRL